MIGYIYKTTNLINLKIYIGQHKSNTFDYSYYGSGKLILDAIKKYGKENFKCELLEECDSLEELAEKEIYYIALYKSTTKDNNYNISDGGFVPRLSGSANGNYGKHRPKTEEERAHLSAVTKNHKPTFTGPHTEETKKKIGEKSREHNLNRDPSIYKKSSETSKGNRMMNKDGKCIRVHEKDFEEYIQNGWQFGGLSRKGKYKNRIRPHKYNVKKKAVN